MMTASAGTIIAQKPTIAPSVPRSRKPSQTARLTTLTPGIAWQIARLLRNSDSENQPRASTNSRYIHPESPPPKLVRLIFAKTRKISRERNSRPSYLHTVEDEKSAEVAYSAACAAASRAIGTRYGEHDT